MSAHTTRWQFADFKVSDAIAAVKLLSSSGSETLLALEGLLTTCACDEYEWAAAYAKMFRWVMEKRSMPPTLRSLELEVPRQFAYMLATDLGSTPVDTVKIEADEGEANPRPCHDTLGPSVCAGKNQQRLCYIHYTCPCHVTCVICVLSSHMLLTCHLPSA